MPVSTAGKDPSPHPNPSAHRRVGIGGGSWLGIDDCQPRAPFKISDQRGTELRVIGHLEFVRRVEQQTDPEAALLMGEVAIQVLLDHVRMSAVAR